MAELFGKSTGTSNGLGGSMHIFSKEHRFHGGHGIVGGQIPLEGNEDIFLDNVVEIKDKRKMGHLTILKK